MASSLIVKHRPLLLVLLVGLAVALLAACRNGEETPLAQGDQAEISCSNECAAHGQCGTLDDEQRAVLGHDSGPAITLHNRFFIDETLVTIEEINTREVIAARDGVPLNAEATPFPHTFYRVTGEGKTAWVSGWCLARP